MKVLSVLLSLLISLFSVSSSSVASEEIANIPLSDTVQMQMQLRGYSDPSGIIPLFDADDEIIAYCYEFDNAYMIVDLVGNVLEHSPDTNSVYYNSNDTAYYGGPLLYFDKVGDNFVDINSNEAVADFECAEVVNELPSYAISKMNVVDEYDVQVASTSVYQYVVEEISGELRELDCNTDGTCGPVAVAIMLLYYDDYVSDNYVDDFFSSSPEALHDMLVSTYYPELGTDYDSLPEGINSYFENKNIDNGATVVTNGFDNYIYPKIKYSSRPVILGLYDAYPSEPDPSPWCINHWVIVHGISDYYYSGDFCYREYIVNNGWGSNDIYIMYSTSYMDGAIGFMY